MSRILHFDTDINTEGTHEGKKTSFLLYRIYLTNSFRINDTLQPWVSALGDVGT